MFENKKLADTMADLHEGNKLYIVLLFSLLDAYATGKMSEKDFLNDIRVLLEIK